MTKPKIVFTGGGTVGHVTLNLILIPKFIQDGWEVHYIGDKKGVEYQEIKRSNLAVTFHGIMTGKLRRYLSWQNIVDVFKVAWGILQVLIILFRVKPKALFSKGGFVAVPPVVAAWLLRVPVFVHESDLSMGLANRIAYRFADVVYSSFAQKKKLTKVRHIGAITKVVPKTVFNHPDFEAIKALFDLKKPTLLFIGGSAGAKVFNDFVTRNQSDLLKTFNVINITGDASLNQSDKGIYRIDYVTDLYQPLMSLADLVITRGGANTLFELLALRKLQLIIPLGKEASRGDQLENADYFVEKGYARQLAEKNLTLASLKQEVATLLQQASLYYQTIEKTQELTSQEAFYQELLASITHTTKDK